MARIKQTLKFLFFYKKPIGILFILGLLSSGFLLAGPFFSKLFIDKAFINKNMQEFIKLSYIGIIVFIFSSLIKLIEDLIRNKIAIKLKLNLANKFIKKFYSLDLSFFRSKSVGENVYRFSDVSTISSFILEQAPQILLDIFKLPIILAISLLLNHQMTISLLVLSPLFLLHSVYIQKKLRPIYEELWVYGANLSRQVYESFSKILLIKVFGLENYQRHLYMRTLLKNIRWGIKSFRWAMVSSLSSAYLSKAIYGVITLYGGWLIIRGKITLGSYTAVMLYLTQLGGLLQSLGSRFEYFTREAISLGKFFEIIDIEPLIRDLDNAVFLNSIKGDIQLSNVTFGYEKERLIFKDLSLKIPSCSWIGIVGPSGCGKTTLVNLLLRLYEPQDGKVFFSGIDLKEIKLKSLRERIAIATQEPFLFDMTIKENIGYGAKGLSQLKLEEAARIAHIDNYIQQLPNGYDTLIGEDACRLSQGLKQRLSLARAIVRNPDLLILDEATSSVDFLTEEMIFKELRLARKGLSTIIISHRLFSVQDSDRIYFLRNDAKVEVGRHQELLSASKAYSEFFHNQLKEDEKDISD